MVDLKQSKLIAESITSGVGWGNNYAVEFFAVLTTVTTIVSGIMILWGFTNNIIVGVIGVFLALWDHYTIRGLWKYAQKQELNRLH